MPVGIDNMSSEYFEAYQEYRQLQRTVASMEGIKEKESVLRAAVACESVQPILKCSLSLCAEYKPYANSLNSNNLLTKFYGVNDGNTQALEVVFDVLDQMEVLLSVMGSSGSQYSSHTETACDALTLLHRTVCAMCSSVDDESKLTVAVASQHSAAVEGAWQSFVLSMCTHPSLRRYVKDCTSAIGRAIVSIDTHLQRDVSYPWVLTEERLGGAGGAAAALQVVLPPPLATHSDSDSGLVPRLDLNAACIVNVMLEKATEEKPLQTAGVAVGVRPAPSHPGRLGPCGGTLLGIISGPAGTGKTSVAIAAAHGLVGISPSEEPSVFPRYHLVRWMTAGPGTSLHTEWIRFASALGVYDALCGDAGLRMGTCRPAVPWKTLIRSVARAIANKDYLLIFDNASSYESIREHLSVLSHSDAQGMVGSRAAAHHILVTTPSGADEWNSVHPAVVVQLTSFSEAESAEYVALRERGRDSEDDVDALPGVSRALHDIAVGNARDLCIALSAVQLRQAGGEGGSLASVVDDFVGQVRGDRGGEDGAADITAQTSCCLPFWRRSSSAKEQEGTGRASTSDSRGRYAALLIRETTSSSLVKFAARWIVDCLSDSARFPPAMRTLLGYISLIRPTRIPRVMLEELLAAADNAADDKLNAERFEVVLKTLTEAHILLRENEASTSFMIHHPLHLCLGEILIGDWVAGSEPILQTRFAVSKLLNWVEPVVVALNNIFVANARRKDALVAWGSHVEAVICLINRIGISGMDPASPARRHEADDAELCRLLTARQQLYLRLAEHYGAEGRLSEGALA